MIVVQTENLHLYYAIFPYYDCWFSNYRGPE